VSPFLDFSLSAMALSIAAAALTWTAIEVVCFWGASDGE